MSELIKNARILVVDDMEYNLTLIAEMLKNDGYTNITCCKTGKDALEKLQKSNIDLVLLDLILEDVDGLEICKSISSNNATQNIPIIVQSSANHAAKKAEAFKFGAKDFISKPIEEAELLARVTLQLKQKELYRSLAENNERMAKELEDAREMLLALLPSEQVINKIIADKSMEISSFYQPSSELGGDFYDVFDLGDSRVGVFVWDFAGHGVGAAINTFRLHGLIQENKRYLNSPGQFLTVINGKLYTLLPRSQFVTMFYGIIDTKEKVMEYSCASCPPPVLISFAKKRLFRIDAKSFPLGIQTKHEFPTGNVSIAGWDALVLYSDALTETRDKNNKFLSIEDIMTHVNDNVKPEQIKALDIKEIIMNKFKKDCAQNLSDDLTLKVITFPTRF